MLFRSYFNQLKPYVGGAIDLGIKKSKLKFIAIMASDLETNPNELIRMIKISIKNPTSIISADRWLSQRGFSNYGVIKYLANFFLNMKYWILLLLIESTQAKYLKI